MHWFDAAFMALVCRGEGVFYWNNSGVEVCRRK